MLSVALAHAKLYAVPASPTAAQIASLNPDEDGALEDVSRQQAIDEGKAVYVSKSLSPLDRLFEIQGGGFGCVRWVVNGVTAGQLAFQQKQKNRIKKLQGAIS